MPPVRFSGGRASAQDTIARINERVGRIGAPRIATPTPVGFEQQGYDRGADAAKAMRRPRKGDQPGGRAFEFGTGQGKLEDTLKKAVRDIEEAREAGDLSADEADEMLRRAAEIGEGLYEAGDLPDWVTEGIAEEVTGDDKKSGLDRVRDVGGTVLGGALREISRGGDAVLTGLTSRFQAGGGDNAIELPGGLKLNRGYLGPINEVLGALGDREAQATTAATMIGAKEGGLQRAHVSPTDLYEASGVLPAARKAGIPEGVVDNPVTHLLTYAALDPTTYVGFGTTSATRSALRAADNAVPGVAQRLRQVGLEGLSQGERSALQQALPERALIHLRGAQGGIRVRTPVGRYSEGVTAIPGRGGRGIAPSLRRLTDNRAGQIARGAKEAVEDAIVPRAAVAREVGDQAARAVDDVRVALQHMAPQQTKEQLDKAVSVALRTVPDLSMEDLPVLAAALDIGGSLDDLPARLRPLGEHFDREWRQPLTETQRQAAVLGDRAAVEEALEARVGRARQGVAGAGDKIVDLQDRITARLAEIDAVEPRLEPAARRAVDAGYQGGRADAVLDAAAPAARRADAAAERADDLARRADEAIEAQVPAETPVDAPIRPADRKEARALVNDLAKRADDAKQQIDLDELPALPKGKIPPGGEWDWARQLPPDLKAAWQRLAKIFGTVDDTPTGPVLSTSFLGGGGATGMEAAAMRLGVDVDEAAGILADRVRAWQSLDQLSRGVQPWWPESMPLHLDPIDEAIVDVLPPEKIRGVAANLPDANKRRTALGQAVEQADRLLPGAKAAIARDGYEAWVRGLTPQQFEVLAQGRVWTVLKKGRPVDQHVKPLSGAQWDALDDSAPGDPWLHAGRRKPGRSTWTAGQLDDVVRATRQSQIDELERHLGSQGLDLPANVVDVVEPDVAGPARLRGRGDEAAREARLAGRGAQQAQARAATAAGKAETAADRAIEAVESIDRQAGRAAEQSLERGKKAAQATRTLNIKLAKAKQEMKRAEKALADAEEAYARGIVADEDYFPRILTPQAVKVMRAIDAGDMQSRGVLGVRDAVVSDKFVSARKAEWATMSIGEINAEMAGVMQEAVERGVLKADEALDWFDTNPFTAFAARDATARRHIVAKQFYDGLGDVLDDTGQPVLRPIEDFGPIMDGFGIAQGPIDPLDALRWVDNLPAGTPGARDRLAQALTGGNDWVIRDLPATGVDQPARTVLIRREIADEIGRVADTFADPGGFVKVLDAWQRWWKGWATVPLPFGLGFHLRNGQGNVFLNWLAGMTDFGAYRRAAGIQRLAGKGIKQFGDPFHFLDDEQGRMLRMALDEGVLGQGFFDIDLGRTGQRAAADSMGRVPVKGTGRSKWQAVNPFSQDFAMIRVGRRFGSAVEDNARMAHFLWAMGNLGDPKEAARSVRRTLFDYSDLTGLERNVFRRIQAFYTFMRKSAPVVAEGFITQPHKLSRIQQVRMSLAEDAEDPEGLYPEYLSDGLGIPIPVSLGDDPLVMMPDLPGAQQADLLTDAAAVAGAVPGVPNLTDRSASEGGRGLLGLISGGAPGAASAAMQAALGGQLYTGAQMRDRPIEASIPARLLGLDRPRDVDGDGDLEPSITQKADFLLESLWPLASKVPWGTTAEQDKAPRRLLSMLTGLRVYPVGEQTQSAEGYRRADDLLSLLQAWYDQGLLIPGNDEDELTERREAAR